MATQDNAPNVIMVPVKRYDVVLTLEQLMTPLLRTHANVLEARGASAPSPELSQLLQRFTELVTELKDVVEKINKIDPSVLASKAGPLAGP